MISRIEVIDRMKLTHQEHAVEKVKCKELNIKLIKKQQLSQALKEDLIKRNQIN